MPGMGRANLQDLKRQTAKDAVTDVKEGKTETTELPSWAKQYEGVAEGYRQAAEKNQQEKIESAKAKGKDTTELEQGLERLQKASPTYYQDLSDEDLVAKRNAASGADRQKYQDEINRRDADGRTHSWTQADQDLVAKREAEAKKAEEPVEDLNKETAPENKEEIEEKLDVLTGVGDGTTGNSDAPKEKDWKERAKDWWKHALNGDKEKQQAFLDSNPSLLKAIFDPDSGLSWLQRIARAGEMLATIGAGAALGAQAGFRGQSAPKIEPGKWASYYNDALKKNAERQQNVADAKNKGEVDIQDKMGYVSSTPYLQEYGEDVQRQLASYMLSGNLSKEGFAKIIAKDPKFQKLDIQEKQIYLDKGYESFQQGSKRSDNVMNQQEKQLTLTEKRNAIKTNLADTAGKYLEKAKELRAQAASLTLDNYKQIVGISNDIVGMSRGLMAQTSNESSSSNWHAETSVKGGIPVIHGSVSGGGGHEWSDSTGKTHDLLGIKALEQAQRKAGQLERATQADVNAAKEALIKAAENYEEMAKDFMDNFEQYQNRFAGVNDGVIKGRGVAQKIVRADGSEVKLNPNDNIYATTNNIEPEGGSEGEVTPMEEDETLKYQKRLGYQEGSEIKKDADYYANILNGGK